MPRAVVSILVVAVSLAALGSPGRAGDDEHLTTIGQIDVEHAWTRATAGPDAAVFLTISNRGGEPDRLVGASSAVSAAAAIHGATLVDGVPGSVEVGPVTVPAGGRLELEPQALFVLLAGLTAPLAEGGELELELRFERAGTGTVHAEIGAADAVAHSHAGHAH